MRCPKCRFENPSDTRFCGQCATPLPRQKEFSIFPTETLQTPAKELTTGTTFADRYQVIEELGKGGMGKVFRVLDKKLNEEVALKLIRTEVASDKQTIERFSNELKLARRIAHRNVGKMYELLEVEGTHFITMEYVSGENLKSTIRRIGQLPVAKSVAITGEICDGLAEAHRLGVVHRDLKPSNIILDLEGNARIMDFGIARSLETKGITGPGVMIGTPEYMSPEQVEGKDVDQRSDIYSLGVILYEMLTGRVPFEGDTPFTIGVKHKSEPPHDPRQLNAQIPEDLSQLILKCLEKDKAKRYQSALDLHVDLEKVEQGLPMTELATSKGKPSAPREITVTFGLKKAVLPILGLAVLIMAAIVIWKILPKKEMAPAAAAKKSIAVLPFEDLSPAKNNESFCDGISDTLINALTNIEGLWVPARTSAFSFRGKTQDIREIGQKLGVENVLEGSIQVAGDNLRVTARISNVKDGQQIWSEIYSRKMADLFSIQDDLAKAIAIALKVRLLGEKSTPLIKNYTKNLEAYRLYLIGRAFWNKRDKADLVKSIEYFEKAIEIDPNYALAYAGLGDAYQILGNNGFWLPEKAFPKAREAAMKALEIDEELAEAHTSLAGIMGVYDWDFVGAEREYKLAIEINPAYATAHQTYANLLSDLGRHDEAINEIMTALNLDPLSPRINANVGEFLCDARRYDQAYEELEKALEVDPNHAMTHFILGWVHEERGNYEDAVKCYFRAIELSGGTKDYEAGLAACYAQMGKREEAKKMLDELVAYSQSNFVSSVDIASVFLALGEKDQALAWLETAFRERDPFLLEIGLIDYRFDAIRSDPRFTDLLKRIGLKK